MAEEPYPSVPFYHASQNTKRGSDSKSNFLDKVLLKTK